jgi:ankyrin repeat protein
LATAYSPDGYQPLALAAFFGHLDVMQFLLRAGVEVNSVSRNALQAAPIHSAAAGNQVEAMRLLLEHGADPNACQAGQVAPLHIAAQKGNLQMTLLLLLSGADLQQKTAEGKTALDLAREANHPEVVELLRTEITKRFRSARRLTAPR